MTESLAEKVTKIMRDPVHIRNICTCAHIDHGKCVSGNSRLLLSNGEVISAKELYNLASIKGIKFEENKGHTIFDTSKLNLNVFSLNKDSGRTEVKPISLAWKLNGGELVKLKLRNGFCIATTPEHKFVTYRNFRFIEKEAKNIRLGDRIVGARNLDIKYELNLKKEILLRLKEKRFYIFLNNKFNLKLKQEIYRIGTDKVIKRINKESEAIAIKAGIRKNRYLIKNLIEISRLLNFSLEEIYDNTEKIVYKNGARICENSNYISLPKNYENFYYLAGLFIGDGHGKKFVFGKPELGKKFVEICAELDISVKSRNYDYRTTEIVTNQTLVEVLNCLFDYPLENKSHSFGISDFAFKSPKEFSSKLLRGYFDADGCVEKSRSAITISSASHGMIEDLSLFLLRFGCIPIIEKDNTITISGLSLVNFVNELGFCHEAKATKAMLKAANIIGSRVSDLISVSVGEGEESISSICSENISKFCAQNNISKEIANKFINKSLAYIEVKSLEIINEEFVYDFTVPDNHNFVAEGMFIHNTTFSDSLLFGAGMMSEELAGKQLALDFHEDEIARGITIDAANISMVHNLDGRDFLINLIDTPGHVDFGGDVTRAMRAVDGAIVLVDAVEGMMPQTETVLRQALKERVKPVLFINKVDRLIREVKLTPEKMQERFFKIIMSVNQFIASIAPDEFKEKWQVNAQKGSVVFGSAFHKWALSVPYMEKSGLTFKDVYDAYQKDISADLAKKAPLHKVVLNMVTMHHPNPLEAQKYRIPRIWHGDLDSELGKSLLNCDPNGPVAFVVTKIVIDKHAGEVAAGRLFSGTLKQGIEVYLNGAKKTVRIQQVSIYKGAQRITMEQVVAGNIIGLVGLRDTFAGETVSTEPMEPFEAMKHLFEPVVTISIEAKKPSDLPRLVEVLRQVSKEDPTIKITINEETGENLMSGMGELHLDVRVNRIKTEKNLDVQTSQPIVVYREGITKQSQEVEGKSPNKHNKFYIVVEPIPEEIYQAIKSGELPETRLKKKDQIIVDTLRKYGLDAKTALSYVEFYKGCVLVNEVRGEVHIGEVLEMIMDGYEEVMNEGPLAREPGIKMKVRLRDIKLHEDAIHRGPAQVLPAVREAIKLAMLDGGAVLYEPMQILQIESPSQFLGELSKLVQNKRGQLLHVDQEGEHITVKAKLPVAEMIGMNTELKSATEGRAHFYIVDQVFEKIPNDIQQKIKFAIRKRKGLNPDAEFA